MMFSIIEAMEIDKALKSLGYDRKMGLLDKYYSKFTPDELGMIEQITLQGCTEIGFLEHLPNLKKLSIISHDYSLVIGGSYEDNQYFNQINDFSVIGKLSKLEYLHIENDITIEELDVRNLDNLKTVYLINNPKLESILGMETQTHLDDVVMYGNNIVNFPNFETYLKNTLSARNNILDISVFFAYVKTVNDAKRLYDMELKGLIRLIFAEKNGIVNFTTLSVAQAADLYIKFRRLFIQKGLSLMNDEYKLLYVFKYVVDYIKFAKEEIEERERLYSELLDIHQEIPQFYRKNIGSLHNSYNTYHFKSGNCEGIVNLMRFMLRILDIETENVHCHDNRYNGSLSCNHALLRAKRDGQWLYYDATYDRKNLSNFFAKTYDEISEYVDLSMYEKKISEEGIYEIRQHNDTTFGK